MPCYKFSYFDARGRGELIRFIFHAAGRDFEDSRLSGESWASFKPSTPFGQVPVLDVDGKYLAQSGAIARFLAREFNLVGKNSWEQAACDQFMGLADDLFTEMVKCFFEKDEQKKKELSKNLDEVVIPKYLALFENALVKNGGKFFVGTELSLADLAVYNIFDTPVEQNAKLLNSYPRLKDQRTHIEGLPKLGEYIKNRKPQAK